MMKRKILLFLIIGIFTALACNLPVTSGSDIDAFRLQQTLSVEQTLIAELFPDATEENPSALHSSSNSTALFQGLTTAVPGSVDISVSPSETTNLTWTYITQPGDTLPALEGRFGVLSQDIVASRPLSSEGLLPVGQELAVPNVLESGFYSGALLPDGEVIFSTSAREFDIVLYVSQAGGYLSRYVEQIDEVEYTGAEIIRRVAVENSINPKLLLAVLDYRSGWVHEDRPDMAAVTFPIGFYAPTHSGLYGELLLVARQLTIGYYGWRDGKVTELAFNNGAIPRIDPRLNAGSVAVQYLFSTLYAEPQWRSVLYGKDNFMLYYQSLFGDPWARAAFVEPLFPEGLEQPDLVLPFLPGQTWSLTGGPHAAWGVGSVWGGVDFAPVEDQKGCFVAQSWATAAAPGLVVRSENGVVAVDLDGDGFEQTGWVLIYLHIASQERVAVGEFVNTDDRIGHPSCEGGVSTGTHVHLARKYNGEWIAAGDALPYILSGWRVVPGDKPYQGTLIRDGKTVSARSDGSHGSSIAR